MTIIGATPAPNRRSRAGEQLVAAVWGLAFNTLFTEHRRNQPGWTGLVRRCCNELERRADAGELDEQASPAYVWAVLWDWALVGDQAEVGVAGSVLATALVDTRLRARFCTPSVLPEQEVHPMPAVFETSLSDRDIGAAAEGDGYFGKVEEKLRSIHGAGAAYPFLDGSTSAIRVVAEWISQWTPQPLVGVNRIAHKAVIHALESHRVPWYYLDQPAWCPAFDAAAPIDPRRVRPRKRTTHVWINSVTYEGVIADVRGVQDALPEGVVLLVDEAWGAHLRFTKELHSRRGLESGADVVTTSVHKQGGGRQGTALLLVREGFDEEQAARLRSTVRATITTSPNLPLLASLEGATTLLDEGDCPHVEESKKFVAMLRDGLRQRAAAIVSADELSSDGSIDAVAAGYDPLKVVVRLEGRSGFEVASELAELGVIVERDGFQSVLFLVPFQIDCHDVELAIQAMARVPPCPSPAGTRNVPPSPFPPTSRRSIKPRNGAGTTCIAVSSSLGWVAADIVAAYPPGIPVIAPGDKIAQGQIDYLAAVAAAGGHVVSGAGSCSGGALVYVRQ